MRYSVVASLVRPSPDGWYSTARHLTTFGLPTAGNSLEATAEIARSIVDVFRQFDVYISLWDTASNTGFTTHFEPERI